MFRGLQGSFFEAKHYQKTLVAGASSPFFPASLPLLLHLADDFAGLGEGLDHLLALLSPADGEVALLEQLVEALRLIHVLQQLPLHLVLGEPKQRSKMVSDESTPVNGLGELTAPE